MPRIDLNMATAARVAIPVPALVSACHGLSDDRGVHSLLGVLVSARLCRNWWEIAVVGCEGKRVPISVRGPSGCIDGQQPKDAHDGLESATLLNTEFVTAYPKRSEPSDSSRRSEERNLTSSSTF